MLMPTKFCCAIFGAAVGLSRDAAIVGSAATIGAAGPATGAAFAFQGPS